MKNLVLLTTVLIVCGCSNPVSKYPDMTPEQKAAFLDKYKKDMDKVYSVANRMGQLTTTHEVDPETDRITVNMRLEQSMPGAEKMMADQIGQSLLESNCKERFMRDFWEAGITYQMIMTDGQGRRLVNMEVSPEKCARFSQ